ncbi:MAG: hypothetical protein ABSF83_10385 [Nitrososphaerales archaeon]|jgi:hypothetical protein
MPQKRSEVVEKVDASQMMPDIYENWLSKQQSGPAKARPGFIGHEDTSLGEQEEEDREEDEVDTGEEVHEKAHRRKRGKAGSSSS